MDRKHYSDPPSASASRGLSPRERRVMAQIRADGRTTRSDLIRTLDLSGTAVFRTTEELAARGLVEIGPAHAHGRGQPSASLWLKTGSVLATGLAVMTDTAEAVLIDLSGAIIASDEISVPGMAREPLLDVFSAFIARALKGHDLGRDHLSGVGLAISGYFLDESQRLNPPTELEDWALLDLGQLVGKRFGIPAEVENIARAAAIGESLLGVGNSAPSFAYINVTAGLGGAFVIDGQLQRGRRGNAGEIGGIPESCGLPKPDLASLYQILTAHGVALDSIKHMLDCYDDRWPGIDQWVTQVTPGISLIADMFRCVLDIDAIVIGGRLPRPLTERLIAAVAWPTARLAARRDRPLPYPKLLPAMLSAQSAAIGAAAAVLKRHYF